MRRRLAILITAALPGAALAQIDPSIPAGNPLDPGAAAQAQADQAQAAQRQRTLDAARRAALIRAFDPPVTASAELDEGRTVNRLQTLGQPIGGVAAPARPGSSPYFQYYRIRTPWER